MLADLLRNLAAAAISFGGAIFWTKTVTRLSNSGLLPPHVARKVSHITTAPFFMLTWPLYSPHPYASLIAAAVPFSISARIVRNPSGDALAVATARDSTHSVAEKTREANGLAAYGASIAAITAAGWRNSAPGYIAIAALCFGDGAADIFGTALQGPRLPLPRALFWRRKTIPGTMAFVLASTFGASGMLRLARAMGSSFTSVPRHILGKAVLASAAVELFPLEDNITVPFTAFFVSRMLLSVN